MKAILFSLCFFLPSKFSYAQFDFPNDKDTSWRIWEWSNKILIQQFNIEVENDFELRFWIFEPDISKEAPTLFILNSKNGKWRARLFETMPNQQLKEITIEQGGLDTLWKNLKDNEILTLPHYNRLLDLNDKTISEYENSEKFESTFSFELLSPGRVRHYSYNCPGIWASKYPAIIPYQKAHKIVQFITNFCKLLNKVC